MNPNSFIIFVEWFFISSFLIINLAYFILTISSIKGLKDLVQANLTGIEEELPHGFEIPISILVPAYNEATSITTSINSMLNLKYPNYEILIINDGSTDMTLDCLIKDFDLVKVDEIVATKIKTKHIRANYQSLKYKNIRVIDKDNGGKADALNAGLNASLYPFFCSVDADSILESNSLEQVAHPFLEDPTVIAAGGTIRIANGCVVQDGELKKISIPKHPLALIQVVEYFHAFLFGRLGWVPFNSLFILSGAFSLFLKKHVIDVGGYRTDTIGEDMELVLRLHKYMRLNDIPYKITFVADPVCWTEAPEDLSTLQKQRIRWQRGLGESLKIHSDMFFNKKMGILGMFTYPFVLFFELLSPIIEVLGYIFFAITYYLGIINYDVLIAFLIVSIGLGILISILSILLEEMTFQVYKKKRYILMLFIGAIIENIGYRQLNSFWRIVGLYKFLFNTKVEWGDMKRKGNWH